MKKLSSVSCESLGVRKGGMRTLVESPGVQVGLNDILLPG